MMLFFVIFNAVVAVILFILSILLLVRKGKPFKQNKIIYKSDEERAKAQKATFNMGIIVLIQSFAMLFIAAGIYFKLWFLYLIALVLSIPIIIWAVKTLAKKKPN